jgi:hypothetical protein
VSRPAERATSLARAASYYVLVALGAGLWWLLSRDGGLPFVIGVCAATVLIVGRLLAFGVSYWRFARQDRREHPRPPAPMPGPSSRYDPRYYNRDGSPRDRTSHRWEQPRQETGT